MIEIDLTWPELYQGALVGFMKNYWHLKHKTPDRYGDSETLGFDYNIYGAWGECALAKWRNVFWTGNYGNFDAPDVGSFYQVRAVDKPTDRLILHPDDNDDQPFVSALILRQKLPKVWLRGWLYARDGKIDDNWWAEAKRPAYFVKQPLNPMETLPVDVGDGWTLSLQDENRLLRERLNHGRK